MTFVWTRLSLMTNSQFTPLGHEYPQYCASQIITTHLLTTKLFRSICNIVGFVCVEPGILYEMSLHPTCGTLQYNTILLFLQKQTGKCIDYSTELTRTPTQ